MIAATKKRFYEIEFNADGFICAVPVFTIVQENNLIFSKYTLILN